MLSKGKKIKYLCPNCNSVNIENIIAFRQLTGSCLHCNTFWPWKSRIKLKVSIPDPVVIIKEEVKMKNEISFSDTLKLLLVFSKESNQLFTFETVRKCLGDLYHPEMKLKDVILILNKALSEMIKIKEFKVGDSVDINLDILLSPIKGDSMLGKGLLGPEINESFTIEEFYNNIINSYIYRFRFADISWCREYIHGKEEIKMNLIVVRNFNINNDNYFLIMDLDTDKTEVTKSDKHINLVFDSSTNVFYNDIRIGKLRFPYQEESLKNIKFIRNGEEEVIDTGISHTKVEAFLDAEVMVTTYLITNNLINT